MKAKFTFFLKSCLLFFTASAIFYVSLVSSGLPPIKQDTQVLNPLSSNSDPNSNSVITIAVYYETKCSDSAKFFNKQLSDAYRLFPDILNIVLIPFGHANYSRDQPSDAWKFRCQHGPDECYGNMIHNCLLFFRPNLKDHFPFINCTMENFRSQSDDKSIECNHKFPIPYTPIMNCAKGQLGNTLLYTSGILTNRLNPAKNYVPWITVNNQHTTDIQSLAEHDLVKLICETYKVSGRI